MPTPKPRGPELVDSESTTSKATSSAYVHLSNFRLIDATMQQTTLHHNSTFSRKKISLERCCQRRSHQYLPCPVRAAQRQEIALQLVYRSRSKLYYYTTLKSAIIMARSPTTCNPQGTAALLEPRNALWPGVSKPGTIHCWIQMMLQYYC